VIVSRREFLMTTTALKTTVRPFTARQFVWRTYH